MAPSASHSLPTDWFAPADWLTLLEVSLTALHLVRPVYGANGTDLIDFSLDYLNPAGQRMTGLPERPGGTVLTRFPHTAAAGIFEYYRRVFETGDLLTYAVNYQADGLDNYFEFAARRRGPHLLVSFTDTSHQDRSAVEQALRASQAREQAARQEAEHQRNQLRSYVAQAPVAVALYRGPQHHVAMANAATLAIWGRAWADVRHQPVFEVLPDAAGPEVIALFDQVFTTGTRHIAHEMPTSITRHGQQEVVYWNFVFEPERQADGRISGIVSLGTDVTEQVRARQQAQQLNQQLEARVRERTRQLRHQQELLSQIIRQVPAAIATLSGPEHRYSFFNDAYQALSGGRPRAGLPVAEVLPEVVAQGFIGLLDQVYATGEPFLGTEMPLHLFNAATGQPEARYVDFIYQPLTDAQHRTQGILAFIVDVTDKVRARQQTTALQNQLLATAQHQAAERLAFYQVFEQTPALVALLRAPSHRYEYVNPAYQALFPGRQLVGFDAAQAVPEFQAQGVVALLDRVYQAGDTSFDQELSFAPLSAPGQLPRPAYYSFTYQAYREQGQVAGVSLFGFDVTEQVLARQAAEASARQLRLVTDALPVLIGYLDRAQTYRFANLAYQAWFGLTPDQLLGRPIREIAGEQAYPNIAPYLGRALAGERVEFEAEMPFRPGFTKHIRTTYIPDVHQGAVQGLYTLVTDVTEQVEARQQVLDLNEALLSSNEKLQESNRQLTRTNVDLDTFVYTASHDLKAPITNIEGILHALRDTLPPTVQQDEVVAHLLGLLDQTVGRFQLTIEQLTDLSRLQQTYDEPAQRLALVPIVTGVLADLAPSITAAAAQVELDVPADLHVSFAPASLRSIVYNLLSNAVKYRDPARPVQVWLRAAQQAGGVVLTVRDNGLGLSDSQQVRLFRAFQRLHTHVAGTGVGLYMIKRLIDNAGAKIAVTSTPGVGSTFTVTFAS